MVFLEHDLFLLELTKLFQKSKAKGTGSVSVSMKKYDGRDKPIPKFNPKKPKGKKTKEFKVKEKERESKVKASLAHMPPPISSCLIRAKLHTRKLSTIVYSKDVTKFQIAFFSLLKGNMDGLKKLKKIKGKSVPTKSN